MNFGSTRIASVMKRLDYDLAYIFNSLILMDLFCETKTFL